MLCTSTTTLLYECNTCMLNAKQDGYAHPFRLYIKNSRIKVYYVYYEWTTMSEVRLHSTCNSRQKAVIVWIRNHQRFCLSLVCLETQEHSDHICVFNELRWILWSQTLFNIIINKEQNVLQCFFHIVNNIEEKVKGVKSWRNFRLLLKYRLFCSPVSVSLLTSAALWSLSVLQDSYTGNKILPTATKEQGKLKDLPKSQVFVLLMKEIKPEACGFHYRVTSWLAGTDSDPFNKRNIHICSRPLQRWHREGLRKHACVHIK